DSIMFMLVVLMILMSGLRVNDSDYLEYNKMYNEVPSLYNFTLSAIKDIHGEIGYLFLSSFFKTFDLPFQFFLFFIASLSLMLTYFSFKKASIIPILSLVFYLSHAFIVRDMIQIRAGLAVSMSLYTIVTYKKNRNVIAGILLASLIHSGAIIIAICYPFIRKRYLSLRKIFSLFLVALIFSYLHGLDFILNTLIHYNLLPDAVANYIGWEEYDYRINIFTNPVFIKGVMIVFLMKKYIKININNEKDKVVILYNLYVLGVLAMVGLSEMAILSGRLSSFLTLGESILIVYGLFYKRNISVGFVFFLLLTFIQMGYDLLISNVHPKLSLFIFG
ncbi:EpsG family protein, partial [Salmonella enterica subsp. enterica serovar Rubislaw]|nr:EpsG family protein [Salmonella enterica]ECM0386459.1 EpsG family protein [Salmonella enterica subsp. enterica serovar Rubislaw]